MYYLDIINKKLNLWLTVPKGVRPVNQTSVTDWQMAVRRVSVISITLRQVFNVHFNVRSELLNQIPTQLSLRGWVDPVPDLIHN